MMRDFFMPLKILGNHIVRHTEKNGVYSVLLSFYEVGLYFSSVRVPVKVFQSMVILTSADFWLLDFLKPLSPSCLIIF